jgi:hypothetical protein
MTPGETLTTFRCEKQGAYGLLGIGLRKTTVYFGIGIELRVARRRKADQRWRTSAADWLLHPAHPSLPCHS